MSFQSLSDDHDSRYLSWKLWRPKREAMWLCKNMRKRELQFSTEYRHSRAEMLSEDPDTEDFHTLTINKHYAKAFEYKNEREELSKCTFWLSICIFVNIHYSRQ